MVYRVLIMLTGMNPLKLSLLSHLVLALQAVARSFFQNVSLVLNDSERD